MNIRESSLANMVRLLFFKSTFCLVVSFAETSPNINGLAQDVEQSTESKSIDENNSDNLAIPRSTESDFYYFPLEELTKKGVEQEFESFLKDPRNAGLNYNLVKRYSKAVRVKFLESFVFGKRLKKILIDFGIDLQKADDWFSELIEKGDNLSLWEIHKKFINFASDPIDLIELNTALKIELESNHDIFDFEDQADFDHIGSRKNQYICAELQNRIDHLIMFASRSDQYREVSSEYFGLVYAVSIWMSRGMLLASEGYNISGSQNQLSENEYRKLSTLLKGVNLKTSFFIEGKQVNSSVASGLIYVNDVFEVNGLARVQSNIESFFVPYLNKRRDQIKQNDERSFILLKEFDQRYSVLEKHQHNFEKLNLSINELLRPYNIKTDLRTLQNKGKLARFLARLARKKISPEDFDKLLDYLRKSIQTQLMMKSEIVYLNKNFATVYSHIEKFDRDIDSHKLDLNDWIDKYNEKSRKSSRKSYEEEIQNLFSLWKEYFPDLVMRFNVAFQNSTSKCLDIFQDIKLKDVRVDKSDHKEVFKYGSIATSSEYKRLVCLLNYELELRRQYSQGHVSNLFDDGYQSIHYNLEDLALEYSMKSSMGSTSPENRSIYGMVYDLMKDRTQIVDVSGKDLQPYKSDVQEILKNKLLPLERQPVNSRGEYSVKLPTGILHSLSGELSDGGKNVDIVWEKPVPSSTFFGTTLGICLGDSWLKSRNNFQKGQGSLELINEISHYMPKKAAMRILARRALLYKYIKLRKILLKKQLIGSDLRVTELSEKDSFALQYVQKMSKQVFIKAKPIHPVNIHHEFGSTWVGFGYGFIGDSTGVRPLVGQAQLSSIFHWEAVPPAGRDKEIFIDPIMDFNYRSNENEKTRYGPIFNLYFPIYKLESISSSPNRFKISPSGFSNDDLKRLFEQKISKSTEQFNYLADGKNYFVRFSDSILRSGLLLMDAFENHEQHPPGISWKQKDISSQ